MGVYHAPESEYAKESVKWEGQYSQYGPPGRAYQFRDYPARLYRVERKADGTRVFEGFTVKDEQEQRNMESRGFVAGGQGAALAAFEQEEFRIAELAAERNFHERRMSDGARARAEAVNDAAGARHIAEVPEEPVPAHRKKTWSRKKKVTTEPVTS